MTAPVPELVEEIGRKIIVLREGAVIAHDTLDGLRQQSHSRGSLADMLAEMIHPETMKNIERYFTESAGR